VTVVVCAALAAACGSGTDASPAAGGCAGLVPVGRAGCYGDASCCQSGAAAPFGSGCVSLGGATSTCTARCNLTTDCPAGSCCIQDASSYPSPGEVPTLPGGWCVSPSVASLVNASCLTAAGNGFVCKGNVDTGYSCQPAATSG
jgi:hypothetical protein